MYAPRVPTPEHTPRDARAQALLELEERQRDELPAPGGGRLLERETSRVRIPEDGALPQSEAWLARLEGSAVPALVVWGERDRLLPVSGARILAAAFRDARVLILPGARHPAYLDRPEAFHRALVEFATRVTRR